MWQRTTTTTATSSAMLVKNLYSIPLKEAQEYLLAHGPNFVSAPKYPPNGEYVGMVEQASQKLTQGEADEQNAEDEGVLTKAHH